MVRLLRPLGASNHAIAPRDPLDYYATDPSAIDILLEQEQFTKDVWECCVGAGHMAYRLEEHGYKVLASDIVDRGYPNTKILDFINDNHPTELANVDIITNPPYKSLNEFLTRTLTSSKKGRKVALFMKILALESRARKPIFIQHPPKTVYICSGRIKCAKNGDFEIYGRSAVGYAWYIWEVGYAGTTTIKWVN